MTSAEEGQPPSNDPEERQDTHTAQCTCNGATVQLLHYGTVALLHCCTRHGLCSNSYQEYSNVNILNSIEPLRNALRSCFTNVMVTIYVLTNSRYPGEDGLHSKIEI